MSFSRKTWKGARKRGEINLTNRFVQFLDRVCRTGSSYLIFSTCKRRVVSAHRISPISFFLFHITMNLKLFFTNSSKATKTVPYDDSLLSRLPRLNTRYSLNPQAVATTSPNIFFDLYWYIQLTFILPNYVSANHSELFDLHLNSQP